MKDERKKQEYKAAATGHPGMEHEGEPLNAAYDPAPGYSPERCDNGYDHNPFGFREGISQAHGIRR